VTDDQRLPHAFVLGWPIKHSRSPLIHRHWLSVYGIKGHYDPLGVPPGDVDAFFSALAGKKEDSTYVGGNVTLPYKETAFRACDTVTKQATRLGAVNTLWVENGRLHGDNTDIYGFAANLDNRAPDWDRKSGPVVVIGAGGAARAVLVALTERGFSEIRLTNRTGSRACQLARDLRLNLDIVAWSERNDALAGAVCLINTTSLGMAGQPPLEISLDALASDAVVNDIVYAPLETPLLAAARRRDLCAVDGLGMLLHQAVPGFERWFGVRPTVTDALRNRVLADLEA